MSRWTLRTLEIVLIFIYPKRCCLIVIALPHISPFSTWTLTVFKTISALEISRIPSFISHELNGKVFYDNASDQFLLATAKTVK